MAVCDVSVRNFFLLRLFTRKKNLANDIIELQWLRVTSSQGNVKETSRETCQLSTDSDTCIALSSSRNASCCQALSILM